MWRRQRGEIKHDTKNEEDASISTVAKAVAIECTCQADFQARKRPKPWEEALPTGTDGRTKRYGVTFTRAFLQSQALAPSKPEDIGSDQNLLADGLQTRK